MSTTFTSSRRYKQIRICQTRTRYRLSKLFPKIAKSTDEVIINLDENRRNDTIINIIHTLTQLILVCIPQYICHFMMYELILFCFVSSSNLSFAYKTCCASHANTGIFGKTDACVSADTSIAVILIQLKKYQTIEQRFKLIDYPVRK